MSTQIFFDFDSTLVFIEGIDELARIYAVEGIDAITRASMEGLMNPFDAYQARIRLLNLKPQSFFLLAQIYQANLLPGAETLIKILKRAGLGVHILSGGFKPAIDPVAQHLGIESVYALKPVWDEQGQMYVAEETLMHREGKAKLLEGLKTRESTFIMIGDGMTDYLTKSVVDKMILYTGVEARAFTKDVKNPLYAGKNLLGLLPLLLSSEELEQIWHFFPEEVEEACRLYLKTPDPEGPGTQDLQKFLRPVFLIPGPTAVDPRLKNCHFPMLGHRSSQFSSVYASVQSQLHQLFACQGKFLTGACSATGMMEALMVSLNPMQILSCQSGDFGLRFHDIAQRAGHIMQVQNAVPGRGMEQIHLPEAIDLVLLTHSETSNGTMSDINRLAREIKASWPNTLVVVDGVSSAGGMSIEFTHLDALVFGTQKCLALPPGLGFLWISEAMEQRIRASMPRSYYFDLHQYLKNHQENNVPYTPAVHLFQLLEVRLKLINKENNYASRHEELALMTADFCSRMGLEIYAEKGHRSATVTSLRIPEQYPDLQKQVRARGVQLASGYGSTKATHFRIGHMGVTSASDLKQAFSAIQEVLHA